MIENNLGISVSEKLEAPEESSKLSKKYVSKI